MKTLLGNSFRRIVGAFAIVGTVLVLGASPAHAQDTWYNGTPLNCYSYLVIVNSRSTGTTTHGHWSNTGTYRSSQWANGSTYQFRISSHFRHVREVLVHTPGFIRSANRRCDY